MVKIKRGENNGRKDKGARIHEKRAQGKGSHEKKIGVKDCEKICLSG